MGIPGVPEGTALRVNVHEKIRLIQGGWLRMIDDSLVIKSYVRVLLCAQNSGRD